MLQKIILQQLRFHSRHGVMEQERIVGTYFSIDLELTTDFTEAMLTDRLGGTVSYADVYEVVAREMKTPSALLEHVAARILRALYATFPAVEAVRIRLSKENPPIEGAECGSCGVEIDSNRNEMSRFC